MRFKDFMEIRVHMDSEEVKNIRKTLKKIPKSHASLVKGFRWQFQPGNTLQGDDEHVGYMDDHEKEIAIAAPWNYGREFTILHELAHRIWEMILDDDIKKEWEQIVKRTKNRQKQNPEELFCMAYANHFVKNKVVVHDHPEWHDFIENLPS